MKTRQLVMCFCSFIVTTAMCLYPKLSLAQTLPTAVFACVSPDPSATTGDTYTLRVTGARAIELIYTSFSEAEPGNYTTGPYGGADIQDWTGQYTSVSGPTSEPAGECPRNLQVATPPILYFLIFKGYFQATDRTSGSVASGGGTLEPVNQLRVAFTSFADAQAALNALSAGRSNGARGQAGHGQRSVTQPTPNPRPTPDRGISTTTWVERDGAFTYIRLWNLSKIPIHFVSGYLYNCANVGYGCGSMSQGYNISAGSIVTIATIAEDDCTNPADGPAPGERDCDLPPPPPSFQYVYNVVPAI